MSHQLEHSALTDADGLHEPKGIGSALSGQVYVANGTTSGTWRALSHTDLSDGVPSYGSMTITNNTTGFALTAVADTTFNTPAQFSLLTGTGAPWAGEELNSFTFSVNRLTATKSGIYLIQFWSNITQYPANNAKVCIRYLINGTTYSTRKPQVKSGGVGASDQLSGFGILQLNAGDYVQLVVASDQTGSLIFGDANMSFVMLRSL